MGPMPHPSPLLHDVPRFEGAGLGSSRRLVRFLERGLGRFRGWIGRLGRIPATPHHRAVEDRGFLFIGRGRRACFRLGRATWAARSHPAQGRSQPRRRESGKTTGAPCSKTRFGRPDPQHCEAARILAFRNTLGRRATGTRTWREGWLVRDPQEGLPRNDRTAGASTRSGDRKSVV